MSAKVFFWLLAMVLLATGPLAQGQQAATIPRVARITGGFLTSSPDRQEAFRQGLRELGYVEGKNILIEWRGAENIPGRVKTIAEELVRLNVAVIVTAGSGIVPTIKQATSTIPIVMAGSDDPVGSGLVASLARPGGNITGLSQMSPELNGKRLEILKEVLPKLSQLAVFGTSSSRGQALTMKEIERAAAGFGVKLQYIDVLTTKDIEPAFRAAVKGRAQAVLEIIRGNIRSAARKELAELAIKHRLPVMRERPEHVEAGGLMSYGVNLRDLDRRAAVFVDKILKGRTPQDLPVEQPIKFEFRINLKAAKAINLKIPPNVLVRADRVIR